jgi:hypothetical protein
VRQRKVFMRDAGRNTFVYGVRGGRVSFAAVATPAAMLNLRRYLKLAGLR